MINASFYSSTFFLTQFFLHIVLISCSHRYDQKNHTTSFFLTFPTICKNTYTNCKVTQLIFSNLVISLMFNSNDENLCHTKNSCALFSDSLCPTLVVVKINTSPWPSHLEQALSCLISEAKQSWAWLVLG